MFRGNKSVCKNVILIGILLDLIYKGEVKAYDVQRKFNISSKTYNRYISDIRCALYDLGIYDIEIIYIRSKNIYVLNQLSL